MIPETDNVALRRRIEEYYKMMERWQPFTLINFDEVQKEQFKAIYKQGYAKITFKEVNNSKEVILSKKS